MSGIFVTEGTPITCMNQAGDKIISPDIIKVLSSAGCAKDSVFKILAGLLEHDESFLENFRLPNAGEEVTQVLGATEKDMTFSV